MSKEALTNLRDYIQLTLSPEDMRWLVDELDALAYKQEPLKPYTMEEIDAMIDQGERDLAEGRYRDIDDLFHEWDQEETAICAAEPEAEYKLELEQAYKLARIVKRSMKQVESEPALTPEETFSALRAL